MIAVRAIGSYVPDGYEANADKFDLFGIDQAFLDAKIGVDRVARKAVDEETSDMCLRAFEALVAKTPVAAEAVDFLAVVTQNPDGHGMPQTSAIVHRALDLRDDCCTFDLSLACSGYVYGLSVAQAVMEANGLETGLLFTADPYSKIIDPGDRNTALLFGDAATATLLAAPNGLQAAWSPKRFRLSTFSRHADDVHNRTGTFAMDGQAVVMFAMREVPGEVHALLEAEGLGLDDIDLFLFHQGSKYIVENLGRCLGVDADKVPLAIAECGNTVSSTIPLVFERHIDRTNIDRVICNGFGVGISVGTCLLERITN